MPPSSLITIQDFLAQKRIAFVGVSRDPKDFSRSLFREFVNRGYDVVPVNPNAAEVMGKQAFRRVQDIEPRVDAALLMTTSAISEAVVADCVEAGIRQVWFYRATGDGAMSAKAMEVCERNGIRVIPGECPFMFFPHNGFHGIHTFIRRITGSYPKRVAA